MAEFAFASPLANHTHHALPLSSPPSSSFTPRCPHRPSKRAFSLIAAPRMTASERSNGEDQRTPSQNHSRRRVLSAGIAGMAGLAAAALDVSAATTAIEPATSSAVTSDSPKNEVPFSQYRGPLSLGYEFSYPAEGWSVKKKPIKTHLSEVVVANTTGRASSSAGVTVDAVKIAKIDDFGSPDDVGAKVVAVENKKDNVLSAALISARKYSEDSLTYYLIEYRVESGRGLKRYLAKATITGGNLYVFTAQAKVDDFDNVDGPTLLSMVESFHVKPQYL